MTTMPSTRTSSGRVVPKPTDAAKLFRLVRDDIALDGKDKKKTTTAAKASTDPAAADDEIAVQVENGTRTDTRRGAAAGDRGGRAPRRQGLQGGGGGLVDDAQPRPRRSSATRAPTWRATPSGSPRRSASRRAR
jgi:hypothetical protein